MSITAIPDFSTFDGVDLVVTTTAALGTAIVTNFADGSIAFQSGQNSFWYLKTQSATVVTNRIVDSATAGRQWTRLFLSGDYWIRTWTAGGVYIDTATGSDDNDGSAAHPLATFAEWRYRLGPGPISIPSGPMVVNVAAGTYAEQIDLRGIFGSVHFLGAETTAASGTLTSFVALSAGGNTHTQVGCATFDFASNVKKIMVITSGAATGARAVIETQPSANNGQTSAFYTQASLTSSTITANVALAGNETFDVRVPGVIVQGFIFDDTSSGLTSLTTSIQTIYAVFSYIQLSASTRFKSRCQFNSCKLDTLSGGGALVMQLDGSALIIFIGCTIGFHVLNDVSQAYFYASGIFGPCVGSFVTGSIATYDSYTLISDSTISPNLSQIVIGKVGIANTSGSKHFIDCNATPFGAYIRTASGAVLYGYCSGSTSIGINDPLRSARFDNFNAITPTLSTTGANIVYGRSQRTWATFASYGVNVTDGLMRTISFSVGTSASTSSLTTLPANAVVKNCAIVIGTSYSGGTGIAIGISGHTSDYMTTAQNTPTAASGTEYVVVQNTAVAAAAAVLVTITGSPGVGACTVTLDYVVPDA